MVFPVRLAFTFQLDMALLTLSSSVLTIVTDVLEPGVSYGKRANWSSNSPMNRSAPVISYGASDSMTFEFGFKIYATERGGPEEVSRTVKSLNALVTPIEPGVVPPPVCYLTYAAGGFDSWPCVCSGVSASNSDNVWESGSGYAFSADVKISLIELDFNGRSANEFAGQISNLSARYR